MTLRPYQAAACDEATGLWATHQGVLVPMATGLGKTHVLVEMIRRRLAETDGIALVLAHRDELIQQAAEKIERVLGEHVGVEKADLRVDMHSWCRPRVIVSSIQTQYSVQTTGNRRCERFNPDDFCLVVCDEAHHYVAESYRGVVEYYTANPECLLLGVTATADRGDGQALGQLFDAHTTPFQLDAAIPDGWLVPIRQRMVWVEGFQMENLHTVAGDFNAGELAAMTEDEANLYQQVAGILDATDDGGRALVYTVRVEGAQKMAAALNSQKPQSAEVVHGGTDAALRAELFARHRAGEYQYLCNVGIATEGYDDPGARYCCNCRPTKSRALYAQIVGRVTRPLPGVVDGPPSAEARRAAIAASTKPQCEVLDFVGNAGRHHLCCTADLLGGDWPEETLAAARKAVAETHEACDMEALLEQLEESRAAEERRKAADEAKLKATKIHGVARSKLVDPFSQSAVDWLGKPRKAGPGTTECTDGQARALAKAGVNPEDIGKREASRLLDAIYGRRRQGLCSLKQAKYLERFGYDSERVTFDAASTILDACFSTPHGSRPPQPSEYGPGIAAMLTPPERAPAAPIAAPQWQEAPVEDF